MRDIQSIQTEYIAALARTDSGLSLSTKEGSLADVLSRATASIALQQDARMSDLQRDASFLSAVGDRLDTLAGSILRRKQAAKASGYVMVISKVEAAYVPRGTVLRHLSTGVEFTTITDSKISNIYEQPVGVQAIQFGAAGNLSAGTGLFTAAFPSVCFRVGSQKTDTYQGDLLGGIDKESDEVYRTRLLSFITEGAGTSESNLRQAIMKYSLVERAYVRTVVPGIVEIWVDSIQDYTTAQLNEILAYARSSIAAGVVPTILQARRKRANLTLDVSPFSTGRADLSDLTSRLTLIIQNFIYSLELGQTLHLSSLLSSIAPLVREVNITFPATDITAAVNEIIVPGQLKFTFPS